MTRKFATPCYQGATPPCNNDGYLFVWSSLAGTRQPSNHGVLRQAGSANFVRQTHSLMSMIKGWQTTNYNPETRRQFLCPSWDSNTRPQDWGNVEGMWPVGYPHKLAAD